MDTAQINVISKQIDLWDLEVGTKTSILLDTLILGKDKEVPINEIIQEVHPITEIVSTKIKETNQNRTKISKKIWVASKIKQ